MRLEEDESQSQRDEIPRQSLLAAMPKRSFFRILVMLAALLGIIYLRDRTSSISGCMSGALTILPPPTPAASSSTPIKARVELRLDASRSAPQ